MFQVKEDLVKALIKKCPTDNPNDGLGGETCAYCEQWEHRESGDEWGAGWYRGKSHHGDCPWYALYSEFAS